MKRLLHAVGLDFFFFYAGGKKHACMCLIHRRHKKNDP